jgi:hypothetical protein
MHTYDKKTMSPVQPGEFCGGLSAVKKDCLVGNQKVFPDLVSKAFVSLSGGKAAEFI